MRKGFTLIELLVVIVIIGILVAIALPNFIKIKDKAKEAEVKQNLHAIQIALERYAVDSPATIYPAFANGGDWTDTFVVWQEWLDLQENLTIDDIANQDRRNGWRPAATEVGDSMIMEAYLPSYPNNPFMKSRSTALLPTIDHYPVSFTTMPPYTRIVGGRESTKMYECFGNNVFSGNSQPTTGDFWVHHIYNNPIYDTYTNATKTPVNGWKSPSGNADLVGNFSYYIRGAEKTAFLFVWASDPIGYTLAGYGAARTSGQDVYNRNGNYSGRFRTEYCEFDCGYPSPPAGGGGFADVPCICNTGASPNINMNDGGSDTVPDGVVITLDSGVDTKSTGNTTSTEG